MSNGPSNFTTPLYNTGIRVDGVPLSGGVQYPISGWSQAAGFGVLRLASGSSILQGRWTGGKRPVNMNPIETSMSFSVERVEDFDRFKQAIGWGAPLAIYFDEEIVDVWHIPSRTGGQTLWRTSRRTPWHLPGITHATRPPRAYIDTAAQTILTSGTPVAGQVVVPQSGGATVEITAPSTISGTLLKLHYRPELLLVPLSLSEVYQTHNHLVFTVAFREHLPGDYT